MCGQLTGKRAQMASGDVPGRRVRHEAGEALGAIGTEECLEPLRLHVDDAVLEVRRGR